MREGRTPEASQTAGREGTGRGASLPLLLSVLHPTPAGLRPHKRGRHFSPQGLKQVWGQRKGKCQLCFLTPRAFRTPTCCQLPALGQAGMGWGH